MKLTLPLALVLSTSLTTGAWAAPNVVASVKPVHALVAAVMGDLGEPTLIVDGAASPHTYALKPSDAGALETADIVFWSGHGMEVFLEGALNSLSSGAEVVALSEAPGIELLPVREGGVFEAHSHGEEGHEDHAHEGHDGADNAHEADHDHDHEHEGEHAHEDHAHDHEDHAAEEGRDHSHEGHDHDHAHEGGDMHFWLDPANAKLMVTQIATTLSAADPENATTYTANAEAEIAALDELTTEIEALLEPVRDQPFLVFHDAYQYFEQRFGLTLAGSVTVSPEVMPGARRIDELRTRVGELGATCVFAEPNFEPAIINAIVEGTGAQAGVLDPEGADLIPGPDLYAELLRGLATDMVDCLTSAAP
jgi:zinc transport system substrate-binding protein